VVRIKIGRNDSCPCGSGRKFKRCCQQGDARSHAEIASNNIPENLPDAATFARALAAVVASGELALKVLDALPELLAGRVDTLLDFLDLLLEVSAVPAVAGAAELSEACLQLVQIQLMNARFLTDRDFASAKRLLQQFEEVLIRAIREDGLGSETIALLSSAMFRAGVEPSPKLMAACNELLKRQPVVEINSCDFNTMLQQALRDAGGDPFDL
jgi:hypothetical protein